MGFELDYLKNNEDCGIYNNTTGQFISFYNGEGFIKAVTIMSPKDTRIQDFFDYEDIEEFFIERDIEPEELKPIADLFGVSICDECFERLVDEDYIGEYEDRGQHFGTPCQEYIVTGYKCHNCGNEEVL